MKVKILGGTLQKFLWIAFGTIGSNRAAWRGLTCPFLRFLFPLDDDIMEANRAESPKQ